MQGGPKALTVPAPVPLGKSLTDSNPVNTAEASSFLLATYINRLIYRAYLDSYAYLRSFATNIYLFSLINSVHRLSYQLQFRFLNPLNVLVPR